MLAVALALGLFVFHDFAKPPATPAFVPPEVALRLGIPASVGASAATGAAARAERDAQRRRDALRMACFFGGACFVLVEARWFMRRQRR